MRSQRARRFFPISTKADDGADESVTARAPPLFDAEIDDRRRMTVPTGALARLSWRSEIKAREPLTFELVDAGRARLLPGGADDAAFKSAAGDPEATRALEMLLVRWRWATKTSLVVPRRVTAHVLETGAIWGALYVWAEPGWLELWSEQRRLHEISRARSIAADHLP